VSKTAGLSFKQRRQLARLIANNGAEFVVLIGSWARGTQDTEVSDIDILLGKPSSARCSNDDRMHVICLSSSELVDRVLEGDDFAAWCLRFGVPLSGRRKWQTLKLQFDSQNSWPRTARKRELSRRLFQYASDLLAMGDAEAAQEELRAALGHLARAELLDRQVFPLSRPEVPNQLREAGLDTLAEALDKTATLTLSAQELSDVIRRFGNDVEARAG